MAKTDKLNWKTDKLNWKTDKLNWKTDNKKYYNAATNMQKKISS